MPADRRPNTRSSRKSLDRGRPRRERSRARGARRSPRLPTHLGLAGLFQGGQGGRVSATPPATILVLEENAAVQELIDQALREAGHCVLTTKNSLEALEIVRRVRVDILVAGELFDERRQEVVDELRSVQPRLGVVSTVGPDDLQQTDVVASLRPPFSLDDLRAAVATTLVTETRG